MSLRLYSIILCTSGFLSPAGQILHVSLYYRRVCIISCCFTSYKHTYKCQCTLVAILDQELTVR